MLKSHCCTFRMQWVKLFNDQSSFLDYINEAQCLLNVIEYFEGLCVFGFKQKTQDKVRTGTTHTSISETVFSMSTINKFSPRNKQTEEAVFKRPNALRTFL